MEKGPVMLIRCEGDLGHVLRCMRREKGLNQTELGRRPGLRQKTISDAETGHSISTHTLFLILSALHLDVRVLEREDPEPEGF